MLKQAQTESAGNLRCINRITTLTTALVNVAPAVAFAAELLQKKKHLSRHLDQHVHRFPHIAQGLES